MALGMRYGHVTIADPQAKAQVYLATEEFLRRFTARHGSIICRELLECDLCTPAGREDARVRCLHQTRCVQYVQDAVMLLMEDAG